MSSDKDLLNLGLNLELIKIKVPSYHIESNMWNRKSFEKGFAYAVLRIVQDLFSCTESYEVMSVFKSHNVDGHIDDMVDILIMAIGSHDNLGYSSKEQNLDFLAKQLVLENKKGYALDDKIGLVKTNVGFGEIVFHGISEKIYACDVVQLFKAIFFCTEESQILRAFENSRVFDLNERADILGMIMGFTDSTCDSTKYSPEDNFQTEMAVFVEGTWRLLS